MARQRARVQVELHPVSMLTEVQTLPRGNLQKSAQPPRLTMNYLGSENLQKRLDGPLRGSSWEAA
jgi:hypothetical protein